MMLRKDRRWSLFVLATALLVAVVVTTSDTRAARGQKGDWEVGLFAGYAVLDDYERDSLPALNPTDDALYGLRFGFFFSPHFSLETSVQQINSQTDFSVSSRNVDVQLNSVRINALYNIGDSRGFKPYLTIGAGYEFFDAEGLYQENDPSANAGAGLRWYLGRAVGVRLEAKYVYHNASSPVSGSQSNYEGSFGVLWSFGGGPPPDEDGDGVPDRDDRCPGTPRGAVVDEFGCPYDADSDGVPNGIDRCPGTRVGAKVDSVGCSIDSDSDGVPDGIDRCPNTPQGAVVDDYGCPVDSDGDGVPDGIDRCPDTPQGATVDEVGCPSDSDGDGVYDGVDRCPDTPLNAIVDRYGCPMDSDSDGVYDGIDKCPGTSPGVEVNELGCKVLFVQGADTLVLKGVSFGFDSADLTPNSKELLDSVAASLKQFPDVRVEVAGHTDSRGNDTYNLKLSQRRAESVRDYLISMGIESSRLTARGYGESQPVATNSTEEGRAENRRVVLRRLD
jgi:outer membrane protein OmpA-like peptidoglycan-associated protein